MKKSILSVFAVVLGGVSVFAADFKSDFKPFKFAGRPAEGTIADCSSMNVPITENERIIVGDDGHLYAAGKRIRIFGTNISQFPPVEEAEYWAKTIASQGYNCVRFHHTDSDWADCFFTHDAGWKRHWFDESAFERFDKFFYELKKAGVYSNINLLTGRTIRPDSKNKLPVELKQVKDWKDRHCYGFWNELAREEQEKYAEKILNHKNPYTGLTYAEDPAVAFVEINNENSMTKGYLDGTLNRFPAKLTEELDVLWTDFLKQKGFSYQSLVKKFNSNEKTGTNLISGKGNLEQHSGAKAELTEKGKDVRIKVNANGSAGWHVQYDLYGFITEPQQMYTISFKAKASQEASVDISVMMNHDPWSSLGFSKNVKLSKEWKDYSFTVALLNADEKPRFTIGGMGISAGTVFEFSDIQLRKGGNVVCVEKSALNTNEAAAKNVASNNADSKFIVKFPSLEKYNESPLELRILIAEFLCQIEADYWGSMNDYLKQNLGIKALTFGTALPCAPVRVMSKFDVVDSHAYWNHPAYVKNQSLLTADDGGTLTNLAKLRVYGKPFSVTEYDHPYPNQFSAEMMPMLAVYASLQDWDCVYTFCYDLSQKNPETAKITGYFDQANNPSKIAAVPVASRIFREFKIKPFEKALSYTITPHSADKAISQKGSAWNVVPPESFGVSSKDALFCMVGAVIKDNGTSDGLQVYKTSESAQKNSDSNEYINRNGCTNRIYNWNSKNGYFIYNDDVFLCLM